MPLLAGPFSVREGAATLDPGHPSRAGLVGYWGFNQRGGATLPDLSGLGNAGTWQGTLGSQWAPGVLGPAGNFNGTDGWVTLTQPAALNLRGPLTLACWVRPLVLPSGVSLGIFTRDGASTQRQYSLSLVTPTGKFRFSLIGATSGLKNLDSNAVATLAVWQHVVCRWDGALMTMFVGGEQQTQTTALTDATLATSTYDVALGRFANWASSFFSGQIDEAAAWSRALTGPEIRALYAERAGLYLPRRRVWARQIYTPTIPNAVASTTLSRGLTSVTSSRRFGVASSVRRQVLLTPVAPPPVPSTSTTGVVARRVLVLPVLPSGSALTSTVTRRRVGAVPRVSSAVALAVSAWATRKPAAAGVGQTVADQPSGTSVRMTVD